MTSVYSCTALAGHPIETLVFDSIKANAHGEQGGVFAIQRLPTDPIGAFTLTLTNVVTGSAIQIESQDGTTTLHNSTAAGSTVGINLSAYAGGSNLNNLRIKVRKGSAAPYYQPYETLTTAIVGSQSIYVSQIPD